MLELVLLVVGIRELHGNLTAERLLKVFLELELSAAQCRLVGVRDRGVVRPDLDAQDPPSAYKLVEPPVDGRSLGGRGGGDVGAGEHGADEALDDRLSMTHRFVHGSLGQPIRHRVGNHKRGAQNEHR